MSTLAVVSNHELDPDILRYYSNDWDEDDRIRSGLHEIELVRTQEIIRRYLPGGQLRVLDVGGGGGVHAEWLLQDGHEVHLVEPVPRHVEEASRRLGDWAGFSCEIGDARNLPPPDESVDAVLLLGPLYHLTDRADRLRTWQEALRVTKVGGVVFGVGISRFASLAGGLAKGLLLDDDYHKLVSRTLVDGQHRNPSGRDFFTTAYCHLPVELQQEAEEVGWSVDALLGVEGFTNTMPHLEDDWLDHSKRAVIVEAARAIESEPSLLGLGPHIMVVGQRSP
jgi:SAM-dependent methyltransferase